MNQPQSKKPVDHWQDEKDRLIAELEKKILGRREQITIQEISAVPLPELVLAAFRNHARSIVRRERPLVLQSTHRFLLEDDEIKAHLRRLRRLLLDRLVLPRDEVLEIIVFAVRLQFDVITKPRAALVDLLFERALERDREDIRTIVAGLGEQRPMISALLDLIGGYPAGPVNREAFVALCRRAEKMAYSEKPVSALMTDFHDLINFCSAVDGTPLTAIDNQTVLGILFERNLKGLAEQLLPALTQKEKWTLPEIEMVLEHQIVSDGLALPADQTPQVIAPPEIGADTPGGNPSRQNAFSAADNSQAEANDANLDEIGDLTEVSDQGHYERVYSMFSDADRETAAEPLALPKFSSAPPQSSQDASGLAYQPLHRLIDNKSHDLFIKKIFKRDVGAYERFIDSLERAENWATAKEMLDRELVKREIHLFSKEAVRLSDLVFSRYFPRR